MGKIKHVRREYNRLVADETLEDYSLRYTPKSFRKFSELLIANTAMGSISFLALEAISASIAISYGFSTAFWAILSASIIIFLTAVPISYHAAKYNIDIDLITRSAGFGYVGSTITSLIYASFSFIFFALEAAIMAQALELYFGLPLAWGYLFSALVIIPLVFYGITSINKLHLWTQPIWLIMMIAPFIAILFKEPQAVEVFLNFSGTISQSSEFNGYYFGFALGISLALIAQIGEQVDYLRFMPPLTKTNRLKWWTSMLIAGPGWIILGFLKQIGGILLASLVLLGGFSLQEAKSPIEMYYIGYQYVFENPEIALAAATFFVVVSQIKINVTNAYAGSLAWSNFFSRITHSHPGRVVWMVFNIGIALLLMELGLFDTLDKVLGLYSNVAIAWIGALTADLVINKPLGLSPKIIEFKRAYLYNINPVGVGSMGIASTVSIISFMGFFGDLAQSYSSIISLFLAFTLSPLIAYLTGGKYYIARPNTLMEGTQTHYHCEICDNDYEKEDMGYCPLHDVKICSLCCSLDSLCHDDCKKEGEKSFRNKIGETISKLFLQKISIKSSLRFFDFIGLNALLLFFILIVLWMVYTTAEQQFSPEVLLYIAESFKTVFFVIAILISILVWWILLTSENRKMAETELEEQNEVLRVAEKKLKESSYNLNQYIEAIDKIDIGLFVVDEDFTIRYMNKTMIKWFGDQKGKTCYSSVANLTEACTYCQLSEVIHNNKKVIYEPTAANGESFDIVATPIINSDGTTSKMEIIRNITEQKKAQEELLFQAHHDALTGLPNRVLFNDRLIRTIEKSKREKSKFALFFIDLDHFKEINDSLGHDVGDEILKVVTTRLNETTRDEDTVARLGGDEFTIILERLEEIEGASVVAEKILHSLSQAININNNVLYVSSSIGISIYPDDGQTAQNLLKFADSAMYKAKDEGRNNHQYYNSMMTKLAVQRVSMETDLREALIKEEFVVYYQPQVNGVSHEIVGLEALVRWQHPIMGMVSPDKFIPLAESTGLIVELDRYVMKTAMTQLSKWYAQGLNPGILAINLAIKQLQKEDFIEIFEALIKETNCKAQWLALEVTEGQIMTHPEEAIIILQKISDLGIELAVDDFGTGYSSLAYLKRLPIDKLKIDQAFVRDLPGDEEDAGITKAVIALAKSLNLKVIAEGVETKEQRDFIVENGCEDIQGYFYSKPVPKEELEELLKRGF